MKILVINAGSSSLKYQLIDMETEKVMAKGLCERIGIDGHLKHTPLVGDKKVFEADIPMPTHAEAIAASIDKLVSPEYGVISSMSEIDAVGHRVLHGGEKFSQPVLINGPVMDAIEECIPFGRCTTPQTSPASRHARQSWATCPWSQCSTPLSIRPCRARHICTPCLMNTIRTTASAAMASTVPPTALSPVTAPRSWADLPRS